MSDYAIPAAFAASLWWLTTGVLLYLDHRPRATFRLSLIGASIVLAAALFGIQTSSNDASAAGAYVAFLSSVLVWGWLELTFLTGLITGPRKHACTAHCTGWQHVVHAIQAIVYHELAVVGAGLVVLALTYKQANTFALWTFGALWSMRLSAKLNLFLGVPNLGEQFLPEHLRYLCAYFRRRPMNLLFPLSITVGTLVTLVCVQQMLGATDDFEMTGFALLSAMLALGVIEHWFLVVPLPSEGLWKLPLRNAAGAENTHE